MGTSGNGTGSTTLAGPEATYKNDRGNGSNKLSNGLLKEKSLAQIPSRFAIAMTDRGWILRNTIIWHKKNAMPSSVLDRFTNKYEQVFFFTKNKKYYFDGDSVRVPFETEEYSKAEYRASRYDGKFNVENAESFGSPRARSQRQYNSKEGTKDRDLEEIARKFGTRRPPGNDYKRNEKGKNPGDVWTTVSEPNPEAHFATFPTKLIEPMVKSGCPQGGVILDPFLGSGTTAYVAKLLGRKYIGIELNPEYIKIANRRLSQDILL